MNRPMYSDPDDDEIVEFAPEDDEDDEDDEEDAPDPTDDICPTCNGSGEGMWDGSRCSSCKGSGARRAPKDEEAEADHDHDSDREERP